MENKITRRKFFFMTAAAGLGTSLCCSRSTHAKSPNARIRHACVGCGGQGGSDRHNIGQHDNIEIVALCDVDRNSLEKAAQDFSSARKFSDWREMFEQMGDQIDSVNISTPDHMHAPIAIAAMRQGMHVYCQKPMCQQIEEAPLMRRVAEENGVQAQMGIQHHSNQQHRMAVELLRAGVIGKVRQTHTWTNRPGRFWTQGGAIDAARATAPPDHLDWDLWLGVAKKRPYIPGRYHPAKWRGVVDFGSGACGDMAIHQMDIVMDSLQLSMPSQIWSKGPLLDGPTFPPWAIVHFQFPKTPYTAADGLEAVWYEAGRKPDPDSLSINSDLVQSPNGTIFIGDRGVLFHSWDAGPLLEPRSLLEGVERPNVAGENHWHQWVDAIRGEGRISAPFAYSEILTATTLLANVSMRFGEEKLNWDGNAYRFVGNDEANKYLGRSYRSGWKLNE